MKKLTFIEVERDENAITKGKKLELIKDITRHILEEDAAFERYNKIAKEINEKEAVAKTDAKANRDAEKAKKNNARCNMKIEKWENRKISETKEPEPEKVEEPVEKPKKNNPKKKEEKEA